MITAEEIFYAIETAIRGEIEIFVTAERVKSSDSSYIFVQLQPARRDEGFGVFERRLQVDLACVVVAENAQKFHSDLYNISDALDKVFSSYLQIGDRYITIYETSARIFDGVLNYHFELKFADFIESEKYPADASESVMQELFIRSKE